MKTYDERRRNVEEHMTNIRKKRRTLTGVTSVALAVAILALVLFVPYNTAPPSTRRYRGDKYYDLIQKINLATYTPPEHRNNLEALEDAFLSGFDAVAGGNKMEMMGSAVPVPDNMNGASAEYVEVTDNQVQGVIEADIFKRSTEFIYYLRGYELSVYSIAKEESYQVGSFTISVDQANTAEGSGKPMAYISVAEMYLSQNCSTVTIVMEVYTKDMGTTTTLVSLDVTDPANIRETNRVFMSGAYQSSRVVDGQLLVMSRYRINADKVDFDDPATFVPQVGTADDMELIAPEDIRSPEELSHLNYTVISVVDEDTLEINDTAAVLSYSDQMYVSQDTIYVTRTFTHITEMDADGRFDRIIQTEIVGIRYAGENLELVGSITLDGRVKDQYSMDQHNGLLRVVTSTSFENCYRASSMVESFQKNVDLYCVDLENWEVAASVIGFAPDGETAESVRFDGDKAYVCTAMVVTLTDPVYFFDLSDLENITYTDTGTIDGYSTSLIQLGDGYLLGIGYGDARQLKIEVYEELGGRVVSVCAYELDATFSEEYKCYYIDRENDLIGLPVTNWEGENEYILLHFDGYDLNPIATASWYGNRSDVRATIIDGYLYVLSHDFIVKQVW